MVLEKLGESLKETLRKIARSSFVDKRLIEDLVKDIQKALIKADVNVKLVLDLTNNIKKRAIDEITKQINPREFLIKVVYEELVKFLGEEKEEINVNKKPFKIMMVGLFGSGKTTTIGKLAKYYSKRGKKVAAIGLDVHRPAAPEQLKQISDSINIDCFIDKKEKDALKIYKEFEKKYKDYDILLIDTAGRDALSSDLIKEIEELNNYIKADERLLVLSADIGQAAQVQAEQFHKSVNITGIIITKLDGTAKGGGALVACSTTGAKIKFIGVGEKVDALESFNPKGFVSRLLGMGDIEALLEKVNVELDEEKTKDLGKKFLKGDFNFLDLYEQLEGMKKLGPLNKIMDMIPGFSNVNIPKDMLDVQEEKLKKWKFIMQSMTKGELEDPETLTSERIDRIAKGSGLNISDVRDLLKQYRQSKKMLKMFKGNNPEKIMKKFKGKVKF
ncbi:MAG: signal recognition particle protein Srp54 [Candidatus Nanoarchaeia archaeon]|nr:signal recognition particle protein Srp54 [Candidatus Nanoarchaeia archaeon]